MKKKLLWGGAGLFVVVLVAALLLFQPWLLFIDETVDEDLPDQVAATDPAGLDAPGKGAAPSDGASPGEDAAVWTELASAEFIDAEHGTDGTVRIVRAADGSRQLWLEDLDTSNGPDLHVWITDQPSGGGCGGCFGSWATYDDGEYVRLGQLKGNQGDQRYDIPDDADLSDMTSVVIWCDQFNVAFGTAKIA